MSRISVSIKAQARGSVQITRSVSGFNRKREKLVSTDPYQRLCQEAFEKHGLIEDHLIRLNITFAEFGIKPVGTFPGDQGFRLEEYIEQIYALEFARAWEEDYVIEPVGDIIKNVKAAYSFLDSIQKSQTRRKEHDGWGQLASKPRFSSKQANAIKDSGSAMDYDPSYGHPWILTLTLPGGTEEAIEQLAKWSGYVANRLTQTVRNLFSREYSDYKYSWFYVWELQKRGALHMHWALASSCESATQVCLELVRDTWFRVLGDLGHREGIDMFERADGGTWRDRPEYWQSDIQRIEKSVATYFSKYAGKVEGKGYMQDDPIRFAPHRWWSSSYSLKQSVKKFSACRSVQFDSTAEADEFIEDISRLIDEYEKVETKRSKYWKQVFADGEIYEGINTVERIISPRGPGCVFRLCASTITHLFDRVGYLEILPAIQELTGDGARDLSKSDARGVPGLSWYLNRAYLTTLDAMYNQEKRPELTMKSLGGL